MALFNNYYKLVKNGYSEFAPDLIRLLLNDLSEGKNISSTQRSYLIDCLSKTYSTKNPSKGFYYSVALGKKKKATGMRDLYAYLCMERLKVSDLSHEEKLKLAAEQTNEKFPEIYLSPKAIQAIYTKGQKNNGKFAEYELF